MTEPDAWALELWNRAADAADGCATQSFGDDAKAAALTIQRAFEERERKLRSSALEALKAARPFVNPHTFPGTATPVREKIEAAITALKETPDAQ